MSHINIYCDWQNVPLKLELADLLLTFAQGKGNLVVNNLYYNSEFGNQVNLKEIFSSKFNCVNVPCSLKNSADNQLKSDVLDHIHSNYCPDQIIIVSGDGDFKALVKDVKSHAIKVIVIANKGNVKQDLTEIADEFYFIEQLPNLVNNLTQKQTNLSKDYLTFDEAIACLIETIKIVIEKRKQTKLSLIASLMCQLFPNYQGVKSIIGPNGTKFKQFKKFVESVELQGKVKLKNEQLFLV